MKKTYFFIIKGIGSLLDISGQNAASGNYKYKSPICDRLALNSYGLNAQRKISGGLNHD